MKDITKIKSFALALILSLGLFTVPLIASAATLPCVPSSSGAQANNDLVDCINNVYKYALIIASIAATMMIMFAGYMYIFSGGDSKKVSTAKSWISSALLGIAVLLTGFLLLKQINPNILTIKNISPETISQRDWYDADTGQDNLPPGLPPPSGGVVPSGTAKELAAQILANSKIKLLGDTDSRSSARQNIVDTSNGQSAWTSARGHKGSIQVPLDAKMLAGILAAANATSSSIQVNYIVGGKHSPNSRHYRGKGFDIQVKASETEKNKAVMDACRAAGATELLGPPGTGYTAAAGHNTHIHCGWP